MNTFTYGQLLESGLTPLMGHCYLNEPDCVHEVRDILQQNIGTNINAQEETDGATALIFACENGNVDVVRVLIDHGADVKLCRKDGTNALMATMICVSDMDTAIKIAAVLLDVGCDVNASNTFGETALYQACKWSMRARDRTNHDAFVKSEKEGSVRAVRFLVRSGANVNARGACGSTILIDACGYTRLASTGAVEYLLKHKADANARDANRKTALMYARERPDVYQNAEKAQLLIKYKARE